ncbi:MAG: SNF2-related protein [Pirellulales bacterium]
MLITNEFRDHFSPSIRARGERYFSAGRVQLDEVDSGFASANVRGSRRRPYEVKILWRGTDNDNILAYCDCPYCGQGQLCKHIWATLLQLELNGANEIITGNVEFGESMRNGNAPPWQRATGRRPNWQTQLDGIRVHDEQVARQDAGKQAYGTRRASEIWYALDVTESLQTGKLTVEAFMHPTLRDGTLGKPKPFAVARVHLSKISREDDRRIFEILRGVFSGQQQSWNDYRTWGPSSTNRLVIPPSLVETVAPLLAATRRFYWQLDSSLPPDDDHAIAWDDGPAWQLRLAGEETSGGKTCRITGQLVRDEESVRLDDAVLLLASGFVLLPHALARLDTSARHFGWIATLRKHGAIDVPHESRGAFLDAYYKLSNRPEINLPDQWHAERVTGTPRGRLQIDSSVRPVHGGSDTLCARLQFLYDDVVFEQGDVAAGRYDPQGDVVLLRNGPREAKLAEELAAAGLSRVVTDEIEADYIFPKQRLPDVVAELSRSDWIVESAGARIRRPGTTSLSVTSGVDWFDLTGQVEFDGVAASLPNLLTALRNGEHYVRLDDGTQGMLPEEWLTRFAPLAEFARPEGDALRFASSQALLLDAMLSERDDVRVDRAFRHFRNKLAGFAGVKPAAAPRGFHGKLRAYQREGLGWLYFLREFRLGGCLADDMGLGKTIQVLALLQSRRLARPSDDTTRLPSIVVVPKSLVFNWLDEAARFTPRLRVVNYTGIDRAERLAECDDYDVLVTTYGTLRRDIAELREKRFDYAILDESQAIKNRNSQAAKACRLLDADHRLAMTGTPVENRLDDLWSMFEFLNPGMLGSSATFAALQHSNFDVSSGGGDRDGTQGNGDANESNIAVLAQALRPFMLRRTKEQVLSELPKKTEQSLYCEMSTKQRKEYERLRDYYRAQLSDRVQRVGLKRAKIHVLEALLRMRQAACHPGLLDRDRRDESSPKLDALFEQLDEVTAEGHKALVFSQFTSLLSIVRAHLDRQGSCYEYLDGRTRQRGDRVARFQNDPECRLFLISLKAGGHGLNLTAADYVFILDPWWNPAVESQAIDRAHRIGQSRPVFAYRLICRDTIEDKIVELQRSKRRLADAIVSADNSLISSLTAEDLALLFS